MLPLQQAYEAKDAIIEYLRATFCFKDKKVNDAFYSFIENNDYGIAHEPYVSLKTPFTPAGSDGTDVMDIVPGYSLYKHQYVSFKRLTSKDGHSPAPTLLTTGTGSGKTECFLFPLLDYCYQWRRTHKNGEGIKAIILYPMNALATDQAKRLAEAIYGDERLRDHVTAGLFIGEGDKNDKKYPVRMGAHNIIEDRTQILETPPDIILTNFKMLDYALMKRNYAKLWHYNLEDNTMLKFLVLDELHTYDGAQGTDVANLIRRLKLKLSLAPGQLCPVGTSATIGSGKDSKTLLCKYASDVFGEMFETDSVIEEDRLTLCGTEECAAVDFIPPIEGIALTHFGIDDTYDKYVDRQISLWHLDKGHLTDGLASLLIVRDLTAITYDKYLSVSELIAKLAERNEMFDAVPDASYGEVGSPRLAILSSLLALIAVAKKGEGGRFPFLYLQVQLWLRELSGSLRVMSDEVKFTWRKDVDKGEQSELALTPFFCRECGSSGWIAYMPKSSDCLDPDPGKTASRFINNNENCWLLTPYKEEDKPIDEYQGEKEDWWVDPTDLHVYGAQDEGQGNRIHVYAVRKQDPGRNDGNPKLAQICPSCCSENSLAVIGTKVATMASVAISQIMSSDMDDEAEANRKILAFTNSVQDAAHQAGFFEARNYRFSLRNAIQNCINDLGRRGELPISLEGLEQRFVTYWKERMGFEANQEQYVYRFFPPDRLGDFDLDTDYRAGKHKFKQGFIAELDLRIGWEIAAEFGFNARIGRTLEKSGASATFFDPERLRSAFKRIRPWLDDNGLGRITSQSFCQFVNGVLHRIRMHGAVDHPFLRNFREGKSGTYELSNIRGSKHFLARRFGPRVRYPKLVATGRLDGHSILDTTYAKPRMKNWYRYYFDKCFSQDLSEGKLLVQEIPDGVYNDFFRKLFDTLCDEGICNKSDREAERNYCIAPSAILISGKVKHICCDQCTSVACVADEDCASEGGPCLEYRCNGKYATTKRDELHRYYYNVYNRQLSPRIFAHEHTGILDREKREDIESQFKSNEGKNTINTLVATSTLEMGIDIGDLNVAMNTSVPPLPANFIQRVGRAGRKSGTALIIDFARNEHHDLFFYAEPKEMMQGRINTPGCYLSAIDILRRHFFAFCLDTWTGLTNENNFIPTQVYKLPLKTFKTDEQSFLNRIITFIEKNGQELEARFRSQYGDGERDALDQLSKMIGTGEFVNRIRKEFDKLLDRYTAMSSRLNALRHDINESNLALSDEERKDMELQAQMLSKTRRTLMNQQLLEFMTDAGLLPNYAFPETGVTLDATVIHRPAADDDKGRYKIEELSIQRPATAALCELAPGNHFYAQKYKMNISGLSTLNWESGDKESLVRMRFCSKCDHIGLDSGDHGNQCPLCGDQSFGSAENAHYFVRMDCVRSSDMKGNATLDDKSDDRERNRFATSKHFLFDGSVKAYGLRSAHLGIEYCKSVDVVDINLGDADQHDARTLRINEHEEVPVKGFVTCRYCGKSTSKSADLRKAASPRDFHYPFCRNKDKSYEGKPDNFFAEVYLYHKFHTEAIKVLLPVQDVNTQVVTDMFIAGLGLGLRDYFEGNPDHVKIERYKRLNEETGKFDRYVILYDTIPGGTGYLSQISRPDEFEKIMRYAWERIHSCDCQNHGKDGCYHCIFTYNNTRNQEKLSRKSADELFRKILDYCHNKDNGESNWTEVKNLDTIMSDGLQEESELETRFICALSKFAHADSQKDGTHTWKFGQSERANKEQYELDYDDGSHRLSYTITPQVDLDEKKGVRLSSRPDFMIRAVGRMENVGGEWKEAPFGHIRGVAIFMDGYRYHASDKHNIFAEDFAKRQSIEESARFMSYTMTWTDMESFDSTADNADSVARRQNKVFFAKAGANGWTGCRNSMERLLHFLGHQWEPKSLKDSLLMYMVGLQPSPSTSINLFPPQPWASLTVNVDMKGKRVAHHFDVPSDCRPEEGLPRENWDDFWRVYNLVSLYDGIEEEEAAATDSDDESLTTEDESLIEEFDDDLHPIVRLLLRKGVEFERKAGESIVDDKGRKVCEAELVSHKHKFAIWPDDEEAARSAGYKVFDPETFDINDIK